MLGLHLQCHDPSGPQLQLSGLGPPPRQICYTAGENSEICCESRDWVVGLQYFAPPAPTRLDTSGLVFQALRVPQDSLWGLSYPCLSFPAWSLSFLPLV